MLTLAGVVNDIRAAVEHVVTILDGTVLERTPTGRSAPKLWRLLGLRVVIY